jgi:ribonucleoside-triphosphate reductase
LGQTFTLSHLAPFVNVSREKIREEVKEDLKEIYPYFVDSEKSWRDKVEHIVEERIRKEVRRGVQTIQYQILTLMTCNG